MIYGALQACSNNCESEREKKRKEAPPPPHLKFFFKNYPLEKGGKRKIKMR